MLNQLTPLYIPLRKLHLYHRGLALISQDSAISWRAEYDEWGNVLRKDNRHNLQLLIHLPGQQYDDESGLHYNSGQGRYITQDPIGLRGGLNLYTYPLNPVIEIDPLGLTSIIIGNGPVPDNPFGHAALATTRDGVMSFGTGDSIGTTSLNSYFNKMQPRRDSWIWVVDTTSEEEECMFNKAKEMDRHQGLFVDNCYSRTNAIFEACGFINPHMNTNSPVSLQVLGGLYGSQHIMIPKGNFLSLPPELNGFSSGGK